MPQLVLGPLLRYVGETEATFWFETDEPCEISVLNSSTPTFCVRGRHYAMLHLKGLEPGTRYPYTAEIDGQEVWPDPGSGMPAPSIRTPKEGEQHRMIFGSCRVGYPHEAPYDLTKDESDLGREVDALRAYALRMRERPEEEWPHLLLMIGDQVYADEVSPHVKEFIHRRREPAKNGAGEEVADFEEYVRLYHEAWGDPVIRWLLSTVSTAMIFDDHDVHDDWNTSQAWLEEYRAKPWWKERIAGAFMSYWLYQHLGNLTPREHDSEPLLQRARRSEDFGDHLHEFALRADREPTGARWTFCRDVAGSRVVVVDSRAGRVLDGTRKMLDDAEWDYVQEHARGDFNHLFIASSLPILLPRALHDLEAWNERVCDGAWGDWFKGTGEKIRQGVDLEHWAAFDNSFEKMEGLLRAVATGERGDPPGSVTMLSGDVHFAYLAEVGFPRGTGAESAVWQAVCSPIRNPLDSTERRVVKFNHTKAAEAIGRALARSAGVRTPSIDWRVCEGPTFDNQIATIDWKGKNAELTLERVVPGDSVNPELVETFSRTLA